MSDPQITQRVDTGRVSISRKPITEETRVMKLYSKALPDPFTPDYSSSGTEGFDIIAPPVNPRILLKLVQDNSYLQQCIQAMVTNTVGFGYTLQFVGDQNNLDIIESSPESIKEQQFLEELFDDPSPFATYQELLNRYFEDKSIFDNAYMETVKDSNGRVIQLNHLPAVTMRITKIDPEPVLVEVKAKRGGKDVSIKSYKHFRRFVQLKSDGHTKIYFKEYGDPRNIDPKTGKVSPTLSKEDSATEVIHFAGYNPSSVYGIPKWYSQLPSILGSRQAELTNLDFFENNAIPAMAILVGGGLLTQDTINLLEGNFKDIKGRGSMNKIAIIEASPNMDAASSSGAVPTPTIKMEPLYASRQQDATFLDYDASCSQKIMSSFRLPPVYVAGSKDYTYACHDDQTEFLSDSGWKKFTDYKKGDKVAVYNRETKVVSYEAPKAFHSYPYIGDMCRFESGQVSISVTPNHTMLASINHKNKLNTRPASDLVTRSSAHFVQSGTFTSKKDIAYFSIPFMPLHGGTNAKKPPVEEVPMDLFLEWLGYYISEGSITSSKKANYAASIGQKKEPNLTKITKCFERTEEHGFNIYYNTDPNNKKGATYHAINYKGLYYWIKDNIGTYSHNKRLPDFIWNLSSKQKHILLDALMLGDGHVIPKKNTVNYHYASNSDELITQVHRLITELGYIGKIKNGTRCKFVYFYKPNNKASVYAWKGQLYTESYEGNVYCFETSTGFFITRRNQKQVILGNSANKSVEVAETQTFIPERKSFDDVWNRTILKSWGIKYWAYRTNNSRISTPTDIINAIATFTDAGAITPNIAIGILNEILNLDIPQSKNLYGNVPSKLLESVLRGAGGEDKTNLIINALKILDSTDINSLEPIKVQTPGNADAIIDPINDPKDAPKKNNQGSRNDLHG